MPTQTIIKKVWSEKYNEHKKIKFALRLADFEVKKGDKIIFKSWDKDKKEFTGKQYSEKVKSVTKFPSPTKFWTKKELEKYGVYVIELG